MQPHLIPHPHIIPECDSAATFDSSQAMATSILKTAGVEFCTSTTPLPPASKAFLAHKEAVVARIGGGSGPRGSLGSRLQHKAWQCCRLPSVLNGTMRSSKLLSRRQGDPLCNSSATAASRSHMQAVVVCMAHFYEVEPGACSAA